MGGKKEDSQLIKYIDGVLSVLKEAESEAEEGSTKNAACHVSVAAQLVERLRTYHLQETLKKTIPGLVKKSDPPLSVMDFTNRLQEIGYVFLAKEPKRTVRTELNKMVKKRTMLRPTDGRYVLPDNAGGVR